MAQSLSKLFVHIVFHIKTSSVKIQKDDMPNLYAYMGAIIKDKDSIPVLINGTRDHVHILCIMSKNIALAKLVEEIKTNSSRWIKKTNPYYKNFAWQNGYGGFSVSPSLQDKTIKYIENQEEHHKKLTFQEEYLLLLEKYGIKYDKQYLWRD
jgi:REP element-mobilizing transposase RayT